ncbi:MAG: MarR family transcriptional regulator [Candidatus Desulforudis sp.]|nr:MarR family transcriptional regulator [Desulforudis sp.]
MNQSFLDESLYKIDELMNHLLRRLHQKIWRHLPQEMTQSQFAVCKLVKQHGRLSVSELAESLGVSLSAVTVTADKLCRAGLLERRRDSEDRRVVWLMLTGEGDRAVSEILEILHRTLKRSFERLPDEDVVKLVEICEKLLAILRAEEERAEIEGEG